ncbi:hypothetical protein, partial [Burkholderia multivorans]|uniref:hypothetical protein n=1 Tax=Burkholderia multivorans TaxID=87883 RepID=UPI001ABB4CFB
CADHPLLELLVVLRHEKHPKGWIGIQLLGCSSKCRAFLFPAECQSAAIPVGVTTTSPDSRS